MKNMKAALCEEAQKISRGLIVAILKVEWLNIEILCEKRKRDEIR